MRIASTLLLIALVAACGAQPTTPPDPEGPTLDTGLLFALAVLETGPDGKPVPQPARLGVLRQVNGAWSWSQIEDEDSNVFHKAMVYRPDADTAGIVTAGGTRAVLRLHHTDGTVDSLWEADFGGRFSRMRDLEVGDVYGDGVPTLAVATHDQGVVATVRPGAEGWDVVELDRQDDTIVHEVELGDLNADGVLEIYATPSAPNKLDGTPQPGEVVRYVPGADEGRVVVAALGDQHAKEILVTDMDQDGIDELYVSVEFVDGGQVEIRRYDADTDPAAGTVVAELPDKLCRFLTAGDADGDGTPEMVAAAHKSGLWLLRPGADGAEWTVSQIDADSGGFEHASIFTDLDGDGRDELYVANDNGSEINRYLWQDGAFVKETLYTHPAGLSGFTWNIMPAPVDLLP
jgi:hypothetical protein